MANLIIQENGVARTRPAVMGEEITIKTPCSWSDVTGVQINGVVFPFYDATGHSLADTAGLFAKDSLIRVLIDADSTRAYILNADTNAYLEGKFNEKADLEDGKVPLEQLPEISSVKSYTATIGTAWTEDENTGVKSQNVAISGVTASHTAKVDHAYTGNKTSDSYATFVEEENQFLTYITNGYAETYNGGITFYIFGDVNTVSIPIVVEVA